MAKNSKGKKQKSAQQQKKSAIFRDGLFGRAGMATTIVTKKGKKKPLKTSVLVDEDKLLEDNPALDAKSFDHEFMMTAQQVDTHRPVGKVTELSKNNSPVKITTPNKTVLTRTSRIGPISLYSNEPSARKVLSFSTKQPTDQYQQSSLAAKLQPATSNKKSQKITLTKSSLNKVGKENRKHKKRHISQNRAMVLDGEKEKSGSATLHAQSAGLASSSEQYEHSHLVAHSFKGKKSQKADNLVMANKHSNTEVIAIERATAEIVREHDVKMHYTAKAKHTGHFAYKQSYLLKSKRFKMHLDLNPQTRNQPHRDQIFYAKHAIKTAFSVADAAKTPAPFTKKKKQYSTLFSKASLVKASGVKKPSHKKKKLGL